MCTIGKIQYERNAVLGRGYGGTIVCRGQFEKRDVAVKIVSKNYYKLFNRETLILQGVDDHPNVVRYFCSEEDANFYYIALEICTCSLEDIVSKRVRLNVEIELKRTLFETALGLSYLHDMSIVHRDIRPQNILFYIKEKSVITKLSDFGLAKDFSHDSQSTVSSTSLSDNWMAPEISNHHEASKATDIYSLGCVYYYTFTKGLSFKENNHALDLKQVNDIILANALIKMMTNMNPSKRISAKMITMTPLFWEAEKVLNFIVDVSNRLEKRDNVCELIKQEMAAIQSDVVREDWLQQLDPAIVSNLKQRRTYHGNSMENLIRAIRNKRAHYEETSLEIKEIFGTLPKEYLKYWISRFPKLLHALYEIANMYLLNDSTFCNQYLCEV